MKPSFLLIICFQSFLFSGLLKSQSSGSNIESVLVVASEDSSGKKFNANTEKCYLTLNTMNGDFVLRANLSSLNTNNKKLDSLISSFGEQNLVFKGNINENILKYNQQQNDEKNYDMSGVLSLNGTTLNCTAQFDPINLADKGDSRNYRMDFLLAVDALKISIKGLEDKLNKQIVFEVLGGKLNIQN